MPKKPKSKSADETQELSAINQQGNPEDQPASQGQSQSLENCQDSSEVEQFLALQLGDIPLDAADAAVIHFADGILEISPYTETDYDDMMANGIKDSPLIRRWVLARILSIGQHDPSFRTMNHVDPNALPQELKAEIKEENLDISKIGPFLMKWGPVFWQLFGPIIMKRINPAG
jgi:hypothetical protein